MRHIPCRISVLAALLSLAVPNIATDASAADDTLHAWRAHRRADLRERCLAAADKSAAGPARFGLLVIPVDFADHRLPSGWDADRLAPRLTAPDGQSLRHYFDVASAGRCRVRAVTAPLVRLPGVALDYSDIGRNGATRTRRLATEAITAVAAAGYDLRLADDDGPDGIPGSSDDDGWVDGVLILHSEAGQENDPVHGVIEALQYYLETPVVADGVSAGPYAVASLASGPGIWAHETAHLLGMEDRYDPLLPPRSGVGDLAGAGGLGVFSLMAAGALGSGQGWNPSLPDAYSRVQLGWCDVVPIATSPAGGDTLRAAPRSSVAHRVWTRAESGPEFFLLEARSPSLAAPFDAALPAAGLVVVHVDENVPEGGWSDDGFQQWHLRARLVEADAGGQLRAGLDSGSAGDLFPGAGGVTALDPGGAPSSDGYAGPSGVSVAGITASDGVSVHHTSSAATPWLTFEVAFTAGLQHELRLTARVHGGQAASLSLTVEAIGSPAWGDFGGGALTAGTALRLDDDGLWRPAVPIIWTSPAGLAPDVHTTFRYTLSGPGLADLVSERPWNWSYNLLRLDFAQSWPGSWVADQPDGPGTSWRRWTGADSPAFDHLPVLVCTGDGAVPAAWPAVAYSNRGRARLTSGPLAEDTAGVRLLHWVDVEALPGGVPMDGAVVSWLGPDGAEIPAEPLRGWPARVDPTSGSALRGRGSFGGTPGELNADLQPIWRTDIIPVPAGRPGPWRLRLDFAANDLWRARGWVIGRCEALTAPLERYDEGLRWQTGLNWDWTWPADTLQPHFAVQSRTLPDSAWTTLLPQMQAPVPGAWILPGLTGPPGSRHELRVTGPTRWGTLALAPVTVYVGGNAGEPAAAGSLGEPWPNPAAGVVRFAIEIPDGATARLRIYDVRGRLVQARLLEPGLRFTAWDGLDDGGRPVPAGTYFLKLDGAGAPVTRKVVLLH